MPTPDDKYNDKYKRKLKSTLWHRAFESGHMERAQRVGNPAFLRLADMAIAFAGPNGHAEFDHGELARFLDADYRVVDRAIDTAVRYRLLGDGSTKRCLQLPEEVRVIQPRGGGEADDEPPPCRTCNPGAPARPARCHPGRERHTSVENGALCDSCYRRSRLTKVSSSVAVNTSGDVDSEREAYLDAVMRDGEPLLV